MKRLPALLRFASVIGLLLAGFASPPPLAQAANLDTLADFVFGQADFTHNAANTPSLGASSLNVPTGVAVDTQGNVYVADYSNSRVLEYDAPLTTDAIADKVFGQPNFTSNDANHGGLSAATLAFPTGVALDAQGNLYVGDGANNRVLEYDAPLSSSMAASRVFGQGGSFTTATANKGGLSASSLDAPLGVALDAQGNLYVADHTNNRILEYDQPLSAGATADKVIGQPGFITNDANHGGISATGLYRPVGVALDAHGNLYEAENGNNRALEYDAPLSSGMAASRVFGQAGSFNASVINNGGLSAASLYAPNDVDVDAQGNLYLTDAGNHRVLEYNTPLSSGVTADHVFGQGDHFNTGTSNNGGLGPGSLNQPQAVAVGPGGSLYVGDTTNNRVLEYDLPVPRGAPALTAISPSRVAAGSPDFTLTVTGANFYGVSVVRWNGSNRPTTFINSTLLTATLSAADVASGGPGAVTVFTPAPGGGLTSLVNLTLYTRVAHDTAADTEQGQPSFAANSANNAHLLSANRLNGPSSVAVDVHSGRLFVVDQNNNRVLSWPTAAALANGQAADLVLGQPNFNATTFNTGGRSARGLYVPFGVALDGLGNLYVADTFNNRVLEYTAPLLSGMAASHVFGQGGSFIAGLVNNGGVSANSLDAPEAVALDAFGNLFVVDADNNRVLEYDTPLSAGTSADRVFGQPNFGSHGFNQGGLNASSLGTPYGAGLDPAGNLFVADQGNNRVLEYNAPLATHPAASRVFGQPNFTSSTPDNGGVLATSLAGPYGLTLDGWGNLYVADYGNNRVLEYAGPLANATADRVFGQTNFTTGSINTGGVSASSLYAPTGVALDGQGRLYVADNGNQRVLEYDWALARLALPLILR